MDLFKSKKTNKFISEILYNKMNDVLKKDEQVILFLNKRGYSTTINCSECGKTFTCPNCDITLTYHKSSGMLRCHYCGYAESKPELCPNCKKDTLEGLGSGTEQVEEEINKLFNTSYKLLNCLYLIIILNR